MTARPLTRNALQVLAALLRRDGAIMYGTDLSQVARVPIGTVYAVLARLEADGLLLSELETEDPAALGRPLRRYYRLTDKGTETARAELQRLLTALET